VERGAFGWLLCAFGIFVSSISFAQVAKLPRIAFIANTVPQADLESRKPSLVPAALIIENGLRELGWVDGKNMRIVWRSAEGRAERLPAIMDEVVAMNVDVIVAFGQGVVAAAEKTRSIPIVMGVIGSMPAQASLSHPTRNITGLTLAEGSALDGKRLALLKEIAPRASRVAIVDVVPGNGPLAFPEDVRKVASMLGIELVAARAENADALDRALTDAVKRGVDALLIAEFPQAHIPGYQRVIHERAMRHGLPVIHSVLSAAETGGLAAYGTDILANYRRTPYFIDRILRGAKPADLPIEQPTRYELIVNKSGARAIALPLPPGVLAKADRIIE